MLKKLIEKLGLKAELTEDQAIEAVVALQSTANANETSLTTANAAKATLEGQLTTANSWVTALTVERDQVKADRDNLTTTNAALVDGLVVAFELAGKVTPAQRDATKARFTANGANPAAIITELKDKKPEMNTKHIEINGTRLDISTANARASALEAAISKRMDADKCDRGTAFDRVKADPAMKQLFEAMSNPTKAAA